MVESGSKIVIVTGPESTGKTSIVDYLADRYGGEIVEEYARSYITNLNREYNNKDILHIAEKQKNEFEKALESKTNKPWFIDTFLIITKVWLKWFGREVPEWINNSISQSKDCLYLLCAPDIEWQADNVRENGGESRIRLFEAYKQELERYNLTFRVVSGKNDERFRNAVNFVDEYWG